MIIPPVKSMQEQAIEEAKEFMRTCLDDPKLIQLMAQSCRRMYDALLDEGFTPEQAIQIVAQKGIGFVNTRS